MLTNELISGGAGTNVFKYVSEPHWQGNSLITMNQLLTVGNLTMKRISRVFMVVVSLLAFENPAIGLGFSFGGAINDNSSVDDWEMQYRGYLQYKLAAQMLFGQEGMRNTCPNDLGLNSFLRSIVLHVEIG